MEKITLITNNSMKTKMNCFIPFIDQAQAKTTIENLKDSDSNINIFLLSTQDSAAASVMGCQVLKVPALNSSETMRQIAKHADADYILLYTKYSTLELGY